MSKLKVNDAFDMHFETYDFTDPWIASDTIVLVHGNTRNSKFWYWYLPRFAAHYKVVTLDWRGHGQSPPPPNYRPNLTDYVDDIVVLLDLSILIRSIT